MFLASHLVIGDIIILCLLVEHTQTYPCTHQVYASCAYILLGYSALFQRYQKVLIGAAAVYIAACLQCHSCGFDSICSYHVVLVEVAYSPAVRNEITVKLPFLQLVHQEIACAGRFTVHAVICAHNALNLGFLYQCLKCRQICFFHILCVCLCIKGMTYSLGAAVYSKMLCTSCSLYNLAVALKTSYNSHAVLCGQVRILTEGLMASAPAGVTEDIYIRCPQSQTLVYIAVLLTGVSIVLCSCFLRGDLSSLLGKFIIEHSRQTDSLREHSCHTGTCQSVYTLVPPVVCGYAQSFNSRCIISQLTCLLLGCHLIGKCFGSFLCRKCFVKVFFHDLPPNLS